MKNEQNFNPDLILREKLALQRTTLANQTTFLAFLRTSMYFLVAGLSVHSFLTLDIGFLIEYLLYFVSASILALGFYNYFIQKEKIKKSEIHIGRYKMEYEK
jgi:putative membrane protein